VIDPFEQTLVTRGTDIDITATVSMPVFLRYFEHLRWNLMQDERLGLNALIDEGHFFVVREQTIELRRRIGQNELLHMSTRFEHVGRSTARVIHIATRARDHAIVARARVTGVWLHSSRRPARLPDCVRAIAEPQVQSHRPEDLDGGDFPALVATEGGDPRSFTHPPERLFAPLSLLATAPSPPDQFAFHHHLTVPFRDLDVFSHVNAATWLLYADDARDAAASQNILSPDLARGFVNRVALFYSREACQGDRLRVSLAPLSAQAIGVWCFREHPTADTEPLVSMRLDLVPGVEPVSVPR
jgi:acyl-CoA thioesterase FadM